MSGSRKFLIRKPICPSNLYRSHSTFPCSLVHLWAQHRVYKIHCPVHEL